MMTAHALRAHSKVPWLGRWIMSFPCFQNRNRSCKITEFRFGVKAYGTNSRNVPQGHAYTLPRSSRTYSAERSQMALDSL